MVEFIGAILTFAGLTFVSLLFVSFIYDIWHNSHESVKTVKKVAMTLVNGLVAVTLLFFAAVILLVVVSVSIL